MEATLALYALGAAVTAASLPKIRTRLDLSRAKHRSLSGHARLAARLARLVPFYEYDEHTFFGSDGAPEDVALARRAGFARLAAALRENHAETLALTAASRDA